MNNMRRMQRYSLVVILCIFGVQVFAQDSPAPTKSAQKIDTISAEIGALSDTLNTLNGDERYAMQLKLFQKNEDLRAELASAINRNSLPKDELLAQVNIQRRYTDNATIFLENKINNLNKKINTAPDEDKLALLNEYQELPQYLDTIIEDNGENIGWLKKLGVDEQADEKKLRDLVEKRLRLVSASVDYFNHQIDLIDKQLNASPESEKPSYQLSRLVTKRRLDIVVDSLRSLITIADQLGLDTSEYKRLMFEVTGSMTRDLLDGKVVLTIIAHWSDSVFSWLANNAAEYLFQLLVFALILVSTSVVAKLARNIVSKAVVSKNLNLSQLLQDFFISISGNVIWIIGLLIGLSQFGVNLTPVLTGFGIASVIVGLALQDTLSNFASGMMLLIYRPFDVGDFVYAGGVEGKVSHMTLVNTTIKTFDNQIIILPNSKIWGDVIKNVTHERVRRVDMLFGIGYGDDLLKAEAVLTDIVTSHTAVLRSPEPIVKVQALNASSVDFIVRPWVRTEDYWDVYWDVTKEVKLRFDREAISIPFPQQAIHLHMVKGEEE